MTILLSNSQIHAQLKLLLSMHMLEQCMFRILKTTFSKQQITFLSSRRTLLAQAVQIVRTPGTSSTSTWTRSSGKPRQQADGSPTITTL